MKYIVGPKSSALKNWFNHVFCVQNKKHNHAINYEKHDNEQDYESNYNRGVPSAIAEFGLIAHIKEVLPTTWLMESFRLAKTAFSRTQSGHNNFYFDRQIIQNKEGFG